MTNILKTVSALAIAAATLTATTLVTGGNASANPFHLPIHGGLAGALGGTHAPVKLPPGAARLPGGLNITCLACNLPRPKPTWPGRNWNHGWNHGWNHWYGFHRRGVFFAGGAGATTVAAVQSAPASAPAAQQVAASPCNCLTKQNLPDGSVMFQDICTRESAIAPPAMVGAR